MRKFKLYSKRNMIRSGPLIHAISEEFKSRFIYLMDEFGNGHASYDPLLADIEKIFLKEYGYLNTPAYEAARVSLNAVVQHFFSSQLDQSLDFIEAVFTSTYYLAGQDGVDATNNLFAELGLGFRLSEYIERRNPGLLGGKSEVEYPTIVPIMEERNYNMAVRPALMILAHNGYEIANNEMLNAFTAARTQHYDEAITNACSSFESFLKSVCAKLGLVFDPQKDTVSKLVGILISGTSIPEFYKNHFESIGTIRNKIGSAHGRGPTQLVVPSLHIADHMINVVCSNIQLIHELTKVG